MAKKPIAKRTPAKKKAKPRVTAPVGKAKVAGIAHDDAFLATVKEDARRAARQNRIDDVAIVGIGLGLIAFALMIVLHLPLPR